MKKYKYCFCVYVFGDYTKYIPYYIYGILNVYPNSFVMVFIDNELNYKEKELLNFVNIDKYLIKQISNYNIKNIVNLDIRGSSKTLLRWLIPEHELKKFEYVYFGDVDILIKKEIPSLFEMHIKHMNNIQLPFSNAIRSCGQRLTGLHLINVDNYYKLMNPIIKKYLNDLNIINSNLSNIKSLDDEHFLFNIVEEGIGFGKFKNELSEINPIKNKIGSKFYRPHHGIHLGLLRTQKKESVWEKRKSYFIENKPQYLNNSDISKMLEILPVDEILFLKNKFNKF